MQIDYVQQAHENFIVRVDDKEQLQGLSKLFESTYVIGKSNPSNGLIVNTIRIVIALGFLNVTAVYSSLSCVSKPIHNLLRFPTTWPRHIHFNCTDLLQLRPDTVSEVFAHKSIHVKVEKQNRFTELKSQHCLQGLSLYEMDAGYYYTRSGSGDMRALLGLLQNTLQKLILTYSIAITDPYLDLIASKFSGLRYLDLSGCFTITNTGLAHLRDLPLQVLKLSECTNIDDIGLTNISSLNCLHSLNLSYCHKVTNDGLLSLASSNLLLRHVDLACCPLVTDQGIQELSTLPLQGLVLDGCLDITDRSLQYLSSNRCRSSLLTLGINYCKNLTEEGHPHSPYKSTHTHTHISLYFSLSPYWLFALTEKHTYIIM